MKRFRKWLIAGIVAAIVGLGVLFFLGYLLVAPAPREIGQPPEALADGETIQFESKTGNNLYGWLSTQPKANGSVLLLHSIRGDRRVMVDRAIFLGKLGYHTLCIDMQAHGESPGNYISLGLHESKDAAAGVHFLRQQFPGLPTAVIGSSLGGAAALMADYQGRPPEAIVVEGVFGDVRTATKNRLAMRLGNWGRSLSPLLTGQTRIYLGCSAAGLSPIRSAEQVSVPVFVLVGQQDKHATPAEARQIYSALPNQAKQFWQVEGAAHVDLHRFVGEAYEQRIGAFLAKHLATNE